MTAFESARLIIGDGRTIENGTIVVDGAKIVQAGAGVQVPAGALRVDLAGKTVMPMIIDTHVHLSPTREKLIYDLKLRAYYGVSAALSLGTTIYDLLDMRNQNIPGAARFFSAGRSITMPEPGRLPRRTGSPPRRKAARRWTSSRRGRSISSRSGSMTRDNKFKKLTPEIYARRSSTRRTRVVCASPRTLFDLEDAKGLIRANVDAFAHGVRDRDIDDEFVAMFKARPDAGAGSRICPSAA